MPLPTGTWIASFAGSAVRLAITSVEPSGMVSGQVLNTGNPVSGAWDEDGQKLTFVVLPTAALRAATLVATGYLFTDPVNLTGVVGSVVFTLAGQIEYYALDDFFGLNPTARRAAFGWYAQIGVD